MALRLGDGLGGFNTMLGDITVGMRPTSVVVADLQGDGIPDIVCGNETGGGINVITGQGGGAFSSIVTTYSMNASSATVDVADFNGDQLPDIATNSQTTSNVTVRLNQCN